MMLSMCARWVENYKFLLPILPFETPKILQNTWGQSFMDKLRSAINSALVLHNLQIPQIWHFLHAKFCNSRSLKSGRICPHYPLPIRDGLQVGRFLLSQHQQFGLITASLASLWSWFRRCSALLAPLCLWFRRCYAPLAYVCPQFTRCNALLASLHPQFTRCNALLPYTMPEHYVTLLVFLYRTMVHL
jgi:hypothetical protein